MPASRKSRSAEARPYHHGNLRVALIEAGVALAQAGGPEAVSIREACRQVGVSHAAAYRHFSDHDALLGAVADAAMTALSELMAQLIEEAEGADSQTLARAALQATGRAYVRFAITQPGLFRTAFAKPEGHGDPVTADDPTAPLSSPLDLLARSLDQVLASGAMPADRRPGAEVTAWSAVHGLSMLLLEGPLGGLADGPRDEVIERVLTDVTRGLTAAEITR